jgi:hypothetical protein
MGRFLPPDHSRGDERTVGGYHAVHARPPAFEGVDGAAYSVEIDTDDTGDPAAPVGAFLVFVRWSAGEPRIAGHLESDFLVRAATAEAARDQLGAMPLAEAKALLDTLIRARAPGGARPWWEAMRDDDA